MFSPSRSACVPPCSFSAGPQHAAWSYLSVLLKEQVMEVSNHSCCSLGHLGSTSRFTTLLLGFVAHWGFLDQFHFLGITFAWLAQASPNDKILIMSVLSWQILTFDICWLWSIVFLSELSMYNCFLQHPFFSYHCLPFISVVSPVFYLRAQARVARLVLPAVICWMIL